MTNKSRSGRQQPTVLGPRKAHDASEPGVLGPAGQCRTCRHDPRNNGRDVLTVDDLCSHPEYTVRANDRRHTSLWIAPNGSPCPAWQSVEDAGNTAVTLERD